MSIPQLLGYAPSTFTQTAALALREKGVPFRLEEPDVGDAAYAHLHPWRRVPVLVHDDQHVFETLAIAIYVDRTFGGPSLQPTNVRDCVRMFQWISGYLDYGMSSIFHSVRERFQKVMMGKTPNEETIRQNKTGMRLFCSQMDNDLTDTSFVVGDSISLADLFVAPALFYFVSTPEGREILPSCSNVRRWLDLMRRRSSIVQTCIQVSNQNN